MQRLHRIGNVIFLLTLVALTFHLLAVSYDQWRRTTCKTCSNNQTFYQWTNSIRHRCYWMPLMNNVSSGSLSVELCIPNQYLYAREAVYIDTCLQAASLEPHTVCVNGHFNRDACKCDYSKSTKAVIALVVVSTIALGCSVIIAHFASYISHDTILKWLLPTGLALMIFPSICMFAILIIMGTNKQIDLDGISGRTLVEAAKDSTWNSTNATDPSGDFDSDGYRISIAWCLGLEVIAFIFAVSAALSYALTFTAKKRPN